MKLKVNALWGRFRSCLPNSKKQGWLPAHHFLYGIMWQSGRLLSVGAHIFITNPKQIHRWFCKFGTCWWWYKDNQVLCPQSKKTKLTTTTHLRTGENNDPSGKQDRLPVFKICLLQHVELRVGQDTTCANKQKKKRYFIRIRPKAH